MGMINNRTRQGSRSRSHPGQARRAIRKKALRRERRAADSREAASLGITVEQMMARRYAAAKPFMARPVVRTYVSPPTPVVETRRYAEESRVGSLRRRSSLWDD